MNNQTTSKLELVVRAIEDLSKYLQQLLPIIDKAATDFVSGNEVSANKYYVECIDAMSLFAELVEGIEDIVGATFNDVSIDTEIMRMADILVGLKAVQEKKDWIALSDILRNELVPEIEKWIERLPCLGKEIKKRVSSL